MERVPLGIYSQIIFSIGRYRLLRLKILFVFEGLWLSVRIVQNGKSDRVSLLTKGHYFRFVLLSQTTKPSQ